MPDGSQLPKRKLPEGSEALDIQIANKLRELKESYLGARERLIPRIDEQAYRARTELADKKSKIGVAFGSNPHARFGKHAQVNKEVVLCRIIKMSAGGYDRNRLQSAWAGQLKSFYENIFDDLPYAQRRQMEGHYESFLSSLKGIIEGALTIAESAKQRAELSGRDARTIKGATILALIPDDLKTRFIMDMTDAYLQKAQQKNVGEDLARFILPEDPYPYVWQAPKGAEVVPVENRQSSDDMYEGERELKLEWSSDVKEKYMPEGLWEPDKASTGEVEVESVPALVVNPETHQPELGSIDYPVYSLKRDRDYQKQLHGFEDRLQNYKDYASLKGSSAYIEKLSEQQTAKGEKNYTYFAQLIVEKYGKLIDREAAGKPFHITFAGKLLYTMCVNIPYLRGVIDKVVDAYETYRKSSADDKVSNREALMSTCRAAFVPREIGTKEAETLVAQIALAFSISKKSRSVQKLAEGNFPTSVYDPNVYNEGIYPAVKREPVTLQTTYEGQTVAVKVPTKENPFYTPKFWPGMAHKAQEDWPGSGIGSLTGRGRMLSHWRSVPWATLSLEAKRNSVQEMKEELEEADTRTRDKLIHDISLAERAMVYDELAAYVKLKLAFNIDDPDDPSIVSKLQEAPPLFFLQTGEKDKPLGVTMDFLVSGFDRLADYYGSEFIDVALDAEHNYGLQRDPPEYALETLKKQIRQAILEITARLRSLRRKAEGEVEDFAFFDLEGNQYPSRQALEAKLAQSGSTFSAKEKTEVANMFIEMANREIRADTGFVEFLDDLIQVVESTSEKEPSQDFQLEIPGDRDDEEELPYIRFERPTEEPQPLAAAASDKKRVRRFTKK